MKENCATSSADETQAGEPSGRASEDGAPLRIWALSDDRAGNAVQARRLAEATAKAAAAAGAGTGEKAVVDAWRLAFRPGADLLPAAVWARLGTAAVFASLADQEHAALGPAPDLVIGAGRRVAPLVAAIRRAGRGREGRPPVRAAQILWPQMPIDDFDRVIAPQHDRLPEAVLSGPLSDRLRRPIGALSAPDPETLAAARARPDPRFDALPRPLVGVLVGGPSGSASGSAADAAALAQTLGVLSDLGYGLAGAGSRRTPPDAAALLGRAVTEKGGFWWGGPEDGASPAASAQPGGAGDGGPADNPYTTLLAKADAFIVTADSVNMTTEAASTGRPVYVAAVSGLSAKLLRFHEAMRAGDHARPPYRPLDRGRLDAWRPTRLYEVGAIGAALAALLADDRQAARRAV